MTAAVVILTILAVIVLEDMDNNQEDWYLWKLELNIVREHRL